MSPKNSQSRFQGEAKTGNKAFKYIGLFIVGLALIGLVFSSVYSGVRGGTNSLVFGRYGNRAIRYTPDNSFGQAVSDSMAAFNLNVDNNSSYFENIRYFVWRDAFLSNVFSTAIAYHVEKSGYEPSSRAIDRRIIQSGPYRTNGEFDEEKYLAAPKATREANRESVREQLILTTWKEDVLQNQYHSKGELDFLKNMRNEESSFDYISIPFSDFPEENVIDYARTHSELFVRLPVSRMTLSDEEVADEVIRLYNERQLELNAFADLAAQYSQDAYAEDGGSMGAVDYYQLTELIGTENADTVFASNESEIVGPFNTDYGVMVFRIDGARQLTKAEERIDDVRAYMLQNEVGLVEDTLIARAEELRLEVLASESFHSVMESEGIEVTRTPFFPVNFGADGLIAGSPESSDDPILSGSASSEEFWGNTITLENIGDVSQPVILNNAVVLLSLASSQKNNEVPANWNLLADYEIARSRETEFRAVLTSSDSKLFVDSFQATYNRIFRSQG